MASYKNIFKITHNDVLPIQGSILIAEPFLQDAYFQRSVVLLIEHTEHGSMGFVLNKKNGSYRKLFFQGVCRISGDTDLSWGAGQPQPFVLYSFLRG